MKKNISQYIFMILLLIFLGRTSFSQVTYTIEDLQFLYQEKNNIEFLLHAKDIRPSERNGHWKSMVITMGRHYLDNLNAKNSIKKIDLDFIDKISSWPTLKNNQGFLEKRGHALLSYLKTCIKNKKNMTCQRRIEISWPIAPYPEKLGIEILKMLVSSTQSSHLSLWIFAKNVANNSNYSEYCKGLELKKVILKYLYDQTHLEEKTKKIKMIISKNLSAACWKHILEDISQGLFINNREIQDWSYKILTIYNKISEKLKNLYLVLFILRNPSPGKIFNDAWYALKKLSKNYSKRQDILKLLKKHDPLPGKIFGILDQKRKKIILDYFSKNFPEYINFYAKTCLSYLSGKRTFKNGNPTPQCKDLFTDSHNNQWISTDFLTKYKKIVIF